eukprot:24589-Pyramimonas_sp.AAC.1
MSQPCRCMSSRLWPLKSSRSTDLARQTCKLQLAKESPAARSSCGARSPPETHGARGCDLRPR